MPATASRKRRPALPQITDLHSLVESYTLSDPEQPPLKIDEEQGIIYGVKLGGVHSDNCHGIKGVTEGTDYTPKAYKGALALYEGLKVYCKHARSKQGGDRGPFEYMGVIRNARWDEQSQCPRGDFHYRKTHPDSAQLLEDVKRGMGGFGFSHHIPPGGFKGRVSNGRLIVEEIKEIKSVDLVDDPATTRNLWESKTVTTTFKAILESRLPKLSNARRKWALALLEDDGGLGGDALAAPMDEMPADNPDDALWSGFKSAVMAILDGDGSAQEKAKKIGEYLKAHEKLTGSKEPEAPAATEEDEGEKKDEEKKDEDMPAKEAREVRELRGKVALMEAGISKPSRAVVTAYALLESESDRTEFIDALKARPVAPSRPTSTGPGLKESKGSSGAVPNDPKAFAASIRG